MRHLGIAPIVAMSVIVSIASAHAAAAQQQPPPVIHAPVQPGPVVSTPSHAAPPPPPPPAPRSVPPPVNFAFPPLMPPVAGGLTHPFPPLQSNRGFFPRDARLFRTGKFSQFGSPFFGGGFGGYGGGYYGYAAPYYDIADPSLASSAPMPPAPTGLLRLSVTPPSAQVFLDSYFVGTGSDIEAQRVLRLDAGPHRLEFRAAGYQSQTVDVRTLPYETATYTVALESDRQLAAAAAPQRAAAPAASGPMYLIPNCYLGNVPPRPSRLPAGCDIKQVQVLGK
jgi:hypothetical protein